jgi:hypothetical protein
VQITVAKGPDLTRHGVAVSDFGSYAFTLLETLLRDGPS